MNKGQLSNTLRKLGIIYALDKLRYRIEKQARLKDNQKFTSKNPKVSLPPDYLIYESFHLNYHEYYYSGKENAKTIYSQISNHIDLVDKKVLDWGCGPARIIRHLPKISNNKTSFYGTDYNKESIDWCKNNISNIKFNNNKLEAKLPYKNHYFDAIYGISIFTHLSEEMHFDWFNELKRVLKPNGILLISMQGENFKSKLTPSENQKFDKGELIVRGNVKEGHRVYSAFHPDKFLKKLFKDVEILEKITQPTENKSYTPQDIWILKIK